MIETSLAFVEILIADGWLIIPILVCSLVAVTITLERGWYFDHLPALEHADHMLKLVTQGKFTDALSLNEGNTHPVLRVLTTGILARASMPEKAMESAGMVEVRHMKRGLALFGHHHHACTLMGIIRHHPA